MDPNSPLLSLGWKTNFWAASTIFCSETYNNFGTKSIDHTRFSLLQMYNLFHMKNRVNAMNLNLLVLVQVPSKVVPLQ